MVTAKEAYEIAKKYQERKLEALRKQMVIYLENGDIEKRAAKGQMSVKLTLPIEVDDVDSNLIEELAREVFKGFTITYYLSGILLISWDMKGSG